MQLPFFRRQRRRVSFPFFAMSLAIGFGTLICTQTAEAERHRPNLPGAANGQAAIALLGGRLPDVAKKHRMSETFLRKLFTEDEDLYVDATDRLFYVEPAVTEQTAPALPEESPAFDAYSPANAFDLESKAGSSRTIYLDFDGHLVSGTAWNTNYLGPNFNASPFDLDGAPATFSNDERLRIIEIWRRVAEDYARFDVNVTTKDPGDAALVRSSSSDLVFGTRAVISKRNATCTNCGGIAYVGVFDQVDTSSYYQPAWVFYDALGNGHGKYVAEAVSHEVGHNGGLSHDGTTTGEAYYQGHGDGAVGWAPIMGNGYYRALTQWSKGEYPNANNTQDDIVVLSQNGIITRSDDHGDTRSAATPVTVSGTSFSAEGLIDDRTDIDYLSFYTEPGEVSISLESAPGGVANLDADLKIYNASGAVLAQSNPTTGLSAAVVFSVPQAGTYYIGVDGVGYLTPTSGGYSDYGSAGYYRISGTANPGSGNQPPIPALQSSVSTGIAPLSITFSGSGSSDPDGTISSYSWNFGDGQSAAGANVQHTFSAAGSYQVVLTVTDNGGLSASSSVTITATQAPNIPPTASVYANPTSGYAPLVVNFSSSGSTDSDGSIASYQWLFGDGGSSSSANPSRVYSTPGTFTATLTVTDNRGAAATASVQIVVSQDPNYIAPPTNLSATVSGSSVNLSWGDNATTETGYHVERGIASGNGRNQTITWTRIATLGANANSYTNSGLASGTYYYRVLAYSSAGSASSNSVKVTLGSKGGKG